MCTALKLNEHCEHKYVRNTYDVYVVPYISGVLNVENYCNGDHNCDNCNITICEAQNQIPLISISMI